MKHKKFSVKFQIATNEEHGIRGAMPSRLIGKGWDSYIPNFAPSHDLVEHGAGEFGALYQEAQALGAVLYIRGFEIEEGFYAGNCRSDATASDLVASYRDAYYSERDELMEFPKFPSFKLDSDEVERFEEFFQAVEMHLSKHWDSEMNSNCFVGCEDGSCDDCTPNWFVGNNWIETKTAIMYGYHKAKRRWEDLNVQALKREIDRAMGEVEKRMDELDLDNVEFTLKCEVSTYGAIAEVVYPYSWM
jgi:hypothetical protein